MSLQKSYKTVMKEMEEDTHTEWKDAHELEVMLLKR